MTSSETTMSAYESPRLRARVRCNSLWRLTALPEFTDPISVREQTEHLYNIENDLRARGVPDDLIKIGCLMLHRLDPQVYGVWAGHCEVVYETVLEYARSITGPVPQCESVDDGSRCVLDDGHDDGPEPTNHESYDSDDELYIWEPTPKADR